MIILYLIEIIIFRRESPEEEVVSDILVMPAFLNYLRKSLLVIQYDLFRHEKSLTQTLSKLMSISVLGTQRTKISEA